MKGKYEIHISDFLKGTEKCKISFMFVGEKADVIPIVFPCYIYS